MFGLRLLLFTSAYLAFAVAALAFNPADRWLTTAVDGAVGQPGTPITLTWSIVPDGTVIPHVFPSVNKTSNIISAFDTLLGNGGGGSLMQRPWFQRIQQSFDRWSALSGVTFSYSPNDDGAEHGTFAGLRTNGVDVRGDIRIAGTFIDGNSGTLGYTIFPDNSDVVLDIGDVTYFGSSTNNNVNLRDTTTHELGHSLGLGHTDSNSATFLMESFTNTTIDGPQLDDIRGVQQLYGDALEKANIGAGNNTPATATDFGPLPPGQSKLIGVHASTGTQVLASETDFVSIANHNDLDYYAFTTTEPSAVSFTLTPEGASYNERFTSSGPYTTVISSATSDLALDIYHYEAGLATLIATSNAAGAGAPESIASLALPSPGQYLVRISGSTDVVQMYELEIGVEAFVPANIAGDFNQDGTVNAADYVIWRKTVGQSGAALPADGDGNQIIDTADYDLWREHFGGLADSGLGATSVPEPGGVLLLCILCCSLLLQISTTRVRIF